jgi:hypothetical protein
MDGMRNALNNTNLADASQLMSDLFRQADNAILTNGHNFNTVGKLAVESVAVNILADDCLGD